MSMLTEPTLESNTMVTAVASVHVACPQGLKCWTHLVLSMTRLRCWTIKKLAEHRAVTRGETLWEGMNAGLSE